MREEDEKRRKPREDASSGEYLHWPTAIADPTGLHKGQSSLQPAETRKTISSRVAKTRAQEDVNPEPTLDALSEKEASRAGLWSQGFRADRIGMSCIAYPTPSSPPRAKTPAPSSRSCADFVDLWRCSSWQQESSFFNIPGCRLRNTYTNNGQDRSFSQFHHWKIEARTLQDWTNEIHQTYLLHRQFTILRKHPLHC
jgi:hypothetical protein